MSDTGYTYCCTNQATHRICQPYSHTWEPESATWDHQRCRVCHINRIWLVDRQLEDAPTKKEKL